MYNGDPTVVNNAVGNAPYSDYFTDHQDVIDAAYENAKHPNNKRKIIVRNEEV